VGLWRKIYGLIRGISFDVISIQVQQMRCDDKRMIARDWPKQLFGRSASRCVVLACVRACGCESRG